jgi:predicted transcriptional regulator
MIENRWQSSRQATEAGAAILLAGGFDGFLIFRELQPLPMLL